jgi:hypothetical protein
MSISISRYSGPRDKRTDTAKWIDFVHGEIHEGNHFEVHVESGAATVATIAMAFKVPSGTKRMHPTIDWKASDRAHIELMEGATWDTNTGTVIAAFDNNRITANTSQVQEDKTATPAWTAGSVLKDPSNIAGGTVLHTDYAYTSKTAGGSYSLARHEWPLANNQTYVIRVTKDSAGNIYMGIVVHWYEHTDSTP